MRCSRGSDVSLWVPGATRIPEDGGGRQALTPSYRQAGPGLTSTIVLRPVEYRPVPVATTGPVTADPVASRPNTLPVAGSAHRYPPAGSDTHSTPPATSAVVLLGPGSSTLATWWRSLERTRTQDQLDAVPEEIIDGTARLEVVGDRGDRRGMRYSECPLIEVLDRFAVRWW